MIQNTDENTKAEILSDVDKSNWRKVVLTLYYTQQYYNNTGHVTIVDSNQDVFIAEVDSIESEKRFKLFSREVVHVSNCKTLTADYREQPVDKTKFVDPLLVLQPVFKDLEHYFAVIIEDEDTVLQLNQPVGEPLLHRVRINEYPYATEYCFEIGDTVYDERDDEVKPVSEVELNLSESQLTNGYIGQDSLLPVTQSVQRNDDFPVLQFKSNPAVTTQQFNDATKFKDFCMSQLCNDSKTFMREENPINCLKNACSAKYGDDYSISLSLLPLTDYEGLNTYGSSLPVLVGGRRIDKYRIESPMVIGYKNPVHLADAVKDGYKQLSREELYNQSTSGNLPTLALLYDDYDEATDVLQLNPVGEFKPVEDDGSNWYYNLILDDFASNYGFEDCNELFKTQLYHGHPTLGGRSDMRLINGFKDIRVDFAGDDWFISTDVLDSDGNGVFDSVVNDKVKSYVPATVEQDKSEIVVYAEGESVRYEKKGFIVNVLDGVILPPTQ